MAHIWYECTYYQYRSGDTKVKVRCQGHTFQETAVFRGNSVSQKKLFFSSGLNKNNKKKRKTAAKQIHCW